MAKNPTVVFSVLVSFIALSGCVSHDQRQAELHALVVYWQYAKTSYVEYEGERVKVDLLPETDAGYEMRTRHLCTRCGLDYFTRLEIADAVANQKMDETCPSGFSLLESEETEEVVGIKRNYKTLRGGPKRYLFQCS